MPAPEGTQLQLEALAGLDPEVATSLRQVQVDVRQDFLRQCVREAQERDDWPCERAALGALAALGDRSATRLMIWRALLVFSRRVFSRRNVSPLDPDVADSNNSAAVLRTLKATKKSNRALRKSCWELFEKYKVQENAAAKRALLHIMADHGDDRAKSYLNFDPTDPTPAPFSLFPYAIARRKIARDRLPDAYFDVGPNGIDWYSKQAIAQGAKKDSALIYIIMGGIILSTLEHYFNTALTRVIVLPLSFACIFFILKLLWHDGMLRAYWESWKALEARGPKWHYENGDYFRYLFIRNNGSYAIELTLSSQRLEAEILGVRARAESLHRVGLKLIGAAALVLGTITLQLLVSKLFHLTDHALALAYVVEAVVISIVVPGPWGQFVALHAEKAAYDRGDQYIAGSHMPLPMPPPLNKEAVEAHYPHGDAGFASPKNASDGLAG